MTESWLMKCVWRQVLDKQIHGFKQEYLFPGHPVCNISVTSCLYVTVSSAIVSNDYNVTSVALDTIDNTSDSDKHGYQVSTILSSTLSLQHFPSNSGRSIQAVGAEDASEMLFVSCQTRCCLTRYRVFHCNKHNYRVLWKLCRDIM